jgi:hypothetical protein
VFRTSPRLTLKYAGSIEAKYRRVKTMWPLSVTPVARK